MPELCPRCDEPMRADLVRTAIWLGDRLCIVEDVPAQVCDGSAEQFYDEPTMDALRRLTEARFPASEASREVSVPVFLLRPRLPQDQMP